MNPNIEALLEVKDLSVNIQDKNELEVVHAVKQADFFIVPGSVLGIVGESGSGKTMTALAIMGLLKKNATIQHGSIFYQGNDLLAMDAASLRSLYGKSIGMIFQEPMASLNPLMKIGRQIGENAGLHLGLKGADLKALVLETMKTVGLKDPERLYHAYPHELSGGMLQRAMIASAVICKPALLIADEPTTALDVTIQAQILDLLQNLVAQNNMSMLFISHNFGVISHISDYVAVMYQGMVMEYGPCGEVIAFPCHPYTQALIQCIPDHEKKGTPLFYIHGETVAFKDDRHCPYVHKCTRAKAQCVLNLPVYENINDNHYVRCFFPEER